MRKRPTPTGMLKYPPDGFYRVHPTDMSTWKACKCGPSCGLRPGVCLTLGCRCHACYWANPENPTLIRWLRRDPEDPVS